jgi:hypothetical protein
LAAVLGGVAAAFDADLDGDGVADEGDCGGFDACDGQIADGAGAAERIGEDGDAIGLESADEGLVGGLGGAAVAEQDDARDGACGGAGKGLGDGGGE